MHPNLLCGRLIQPKTPEIGTCGISAWPSGRRLTTPVLSKMLVATLNCRRKLLVIAASLILLVVVGLYWSGGREEGTLFCLCSCSACSGTSFTYAKTDELWRHQIYPVAEQLFDINLASKPRCVCIRNKQIKRLRSPNEKQYSDEGRRCACLVMTRTLPWIYTLVSMKVHTNSRVVSTRCQHFGCGNSSKSTINFGAFPKSCPQPSLLFPTYFSVERAFRTSYCVVYHLERQIFSENPASFND